MKWIIGVMSVLIVAGATGNEASVEETDRPEFSIAVSLTDGSRVLGTTSLETLPVRSEALGKLNVPLNQIATVKFSKDRESVELTLRNGDRIQGGLAETTLKLATLFGSITVPLDKATEMQVRELWSGAIPQGLTLWNTLDSQSDIANSRHGPGGVFKGGEYCDGKFGRAFVARFDQSLQVTFPIEVVNAGAGCIEFWARLSGVPRELAWGQNPTLIRAGSPARHYILHLNGNDGAGRGGLCASAIGGAGTGAFGSWSYGQVLGEKSVEEWHHYALVWDKDGIDGINRHPSVAVFLDGRLHCTGVADGNPNPAPMDGELGLMFTQHLRQGTVAFDNLKVWNYAKTDFKNLNEE